MYIVNLEQDLCYLLVSFLIPFLAVFGELNSMCTCNEPCCTTKVLCLLKNHNVHQCYMYMIQSYYMYFIHVTVAITKVLYFVCRDVNA